jgi:hypothetical protein
MSSKQDSEALKELGHAVGFESDWWINKVSGGLMDIVRSNIMDESQGIPTHPEAFRYVI